MDYTVVICAYNEGENLSALLRRMPKDIPKKNIIVVDDGSLDDTFDRATLFKMRVLRHDINSGKGKAIRTGLAAAETDVVVLMDGDNQHDPNDIERLVNALERHKYDMLIGSRFLGRSDMPFYRNVANNILSIISRISGIGVSDPISGYRVLRKSKFETGKLREKGFNLELELLYNARHRNLRVGEVPINVPFIRKRGSVLNSLPHALRVYGSMVLYSLRRALFD